MEIILGEVRESFKSGKTRSLEWRKKQLTALINLIQDNEQKLSKALFHDLGKHPAEAYRDEIGCPISLVFFPAKGELQPEPLGVILIFSCWNFPISLALDPLIGAISAGNAVVLKPSDQAPACSSVLANLIPLYMDSKAIQVIEGGPQICEKILLHKWDKIFFTGSAQIGRIVMTAAAKHLTPVTLELGGKCPTILDSLSTTSDLKVAVKRIAGAKWGPCSGQACIAVDYLLVEANFAPTVIEMLKKTIKRFYGEKPIESKSLARIVNQRHFERLTGFLKDPLVAASIIHDPPLDAAIMNEEIFGPFLPIITLNKIEESIEFIKSRPKPLTIYAFTKDEKFKRRILSETSSGTVMFNDFLCDTLPFGGVDQSGFGRYHGKYSFDTFSHEKAIMQGSFLIEIEPRYPPWTDFKMKFIRLAYRLNYFGILLLLLGLKK
ncbi:hypothetical protein F8388_009302 [Cannabis sativa]|uniref:Aldehyde dehydrogenase n=1 Tax=Cannabis sativa TaxID=3483 RepID=A0A7J6DLS9_CANSA|nr:hypothetical protein G4B88_026260 [Cannabis sativa]KAF4383271.1 hypothetical protein F8388_009302 [Cannabis sativa]